MASPAELGTYQGDCHNQRCGANRADDPVIDGSQQNVPHASSYAEGNYPFTRRRRGFFALAFLLALRVAFARMAPARFLETPIRLAMRPCTAWKPGCSLSILPCSFFISASDIILPLGILCIPSFMVHSVYFLDFFLSTARLATFMAFFFFGIMAYSIGCHLSFGWGTDARGCRISPDSGPGLGRLSSVGCPS